MNHIAIFTLNGCILCAELKTGHDVLPTVFIQSDNQGNGVVYTPGRDFQDVDEIIEIIKKNM